MAYQPSWEYTGRNIVIKNKDEDVKPNIIWCNKNTSFQYLMQENENRKVILLFFLKKVMVQPLIFSLQIRFAYSYYELKIVIISKLFQRKCFQTYYISSLTPSLLLHFGWNIFTIIILRIFILQLFLLHLFSTTGCLTKADYYFTCYRRGRRAWERSQQKFPRSNFEFGFPIPFAVSIIVTPPSLLKMASF